METLSSVLPFLLMVALAATVLALFIGIGAFVKSGKFNKEYSNKLMRYRVGFQFAAVVVLGLLFLFGVHPGS